MFCGEVLAQQSIITIPSADVLKPNQTSLRTGNRFRPFSPDAEVSSNFSFAYGFKNNADFAIGINPINISDIPNSDVNDADVNMDFQAKKVFNIRKKYKINPEYKGYSKIKRSYHPC
ncbi:MAG: hypothetical protein MZV64_27835 [Ignavibacteriales bacterium]|nr:hypothetical protein [Ignavibacteriales bacterium]